MILTFQDETANCTLAKISTYITVLYYTQSQFFSSYKTRYGSNFITAYSYIFQIEKVWETYACNLKIFNSWGSVLENFNVYEHAIFFLI